MAVAHCVSQDIARPSLRDGMGWGRKFCGTMSMRRAIRLTWDCTTRFNARRLLLLVRLTFA
ncbi:unnamed protein product [Prunus armeniaca]